MRYAGDSIRFIVFIDADVFSFSFRITNYSTIILIDIFMMSKTWGWFNTFTTNEGRPTMTRGDDHPTRGCRGGYSEVTMNVRIGTG